MVKSIPIPDSIVIRLGGYTGFEPAGWRRYLRRVLRENHPGYYLRHLFSHPAVRQENDCIFQSLKALLLDQFGILAPDSTVFQVFNEAGQGILPRDLPAAVAAVIEPFGLEIDQVLVVNPTLRSELDTAQVVGLECNADFANRPGICMINIRPGYSHAFYWPGMNADKFADERFRLALTIRRKEPQQEGFSLPAGIEDFGRLLQEKPSRSIHAAREKIKAQFLELAVRVKDQAVLTPEDLQSLRGALQQIQDQLGPARTSGESRDLLNAAGLLSSLLAAQAAA